LTGLIDDSTMLYEILNVKIHEDIDKFGEEVIDKCSRLLGARRVYLKIEINGNAKYYMLGFRNVNEAEDIIKKVKIDCRGNVFLHEFSRGVFYIEMNYRIDCGDRRIISSFASRIEEIAERFAAEKSRIEFEQLKVLVNSIPDAVVVIDSTGKIVDVNDKFSKITYLSPSEVIGRNIDEISFFRNIKNEINKKSKIKININKYIFEINSAKIPETDKIVLVMRNITELEMTNRRLQTLVDCLRSYVFMKDKNLRYILVNKSFAKFLGKNKDEIIGKRDEDLLPEDFVKVCRSTDLKILKTGKIQTFEVKLKIDGNVKFFEGYKVPVFSGRDVNSIVGVVRDVTERRKVEELRRFRALLDYSVDAIFITDTDGNIVDMNEIARKWARSRDAKKIYDIISGDWSSNSFEGYLDNRVVHVSIREAEFAEKVYKVITVRDITDLKKAQEKIKNMNNQLKFLNRILRHDIANNLTAIIGLLEMYKDSGDRKYFNMVENIIDRSVDLIQKIRDYETMITEGKLSSVNIKEVIEGVLENINLDDVKIKFKGDDCFVIADEFVSSVFENIINNAVQHNTKRNKEIYIEIDCSGDYAEVKVADNGPGIPDKIKDRIFEEGFTYGTTGRTGVGLYIVKSLMEKYDGSVRVEDNKPEGSVFILRFKKSTK